MAASDYSILRQGKQLLKTSVSMLSSNLHSNGKHMVYAHLNSASLVEDSSRLEAGAATETRSAYAEPDSVASAKFCRLNTTDYLVLVSYSGMIQIFDDSGNKLLHTLQIQDDHNQPVALSCISSNKFNQVLIGCQDDRVLCLSVSHNLWSTAKTMCTMKSSVVAVEGCATHFAAADDAGHLNIYSLPAGDLLQEFVVDQDMITGMHFSNDLLITVALSGKIRIVNIKTMEKVVEIDAHARPIHALDVWTERNIFVVGSEDSHLSLWTLPDADGHVRSLYYGEIANALICGVQFNRSCAQTTVSVVSYDSNALHVLTFTQ